MTVHLTNYLVIDVATAPIEGAAVYLEGTIRAPANYKDADKIAAYVAEKELERATMAAVDLDLARVTAVGWCASNVVEVYDARDEADERALLADVADRLDDNPILVTYGGFHFDLPLLMRRARYLGIPFPRIDLDRYRSDHVDLLDLLSDRNKDRRRSLGFYVKRLGWTDLTKPLAGADEARVFETGQWEALAESVFHDVTATRRLGAWLGLLPPVAVEALAADDAEQVC